MGHGGGRRHRAQEHHEKDGRDAHDTPRPLLRDQATVHAFLGYQATVAAEFQDEHGETHVT